MEVKIKNQNELIDATIETVDGIIVVSPVVKFEPKDGDVIYCKNSVCSYVALFRNIAKRGDIFFRYAVLIDNEELKINTKEFDFSDYCNPRPATEEEKQKLFDKLAEEGLEWDAEKRQLVKLKWKPQDHEKVYVAGFTFYGSNPFCAFEDTAYSGSMQWRAVLERGWYFKTEQECQAFCDRLNKAIENIKP